MPTLHCFEAAAAVAADSCELKSLLGVSCTSTRLIASNACRLTHCIIYTQ